jgi:hypothetical protein
VFIAAGWWFSHGTPVSSTNKTDYRDIAEILLKATLDTLTLETLIYIYICRDMNDSLFSSKKNLDLDGSVSLPLFPLL